MKCFNVGYKIKADDFIRHIFIKAATKHEAEIKALDHVSANLDNYGWVSIHETKEQGLWSNFEVNNKRKYQGD